VGVPLGVAFTPFETRADVMMRLAIRADVLGFRRVELAEGWTHDATILLAEIAQRTSRIELATSVLSTWGRTPGTIAMSAAGLQRCSGGRFTLGLGASSPPLTEGFHGIEWDRPATQLRSTVSAVRALLDGERLPSPAAGARPLRLGVLPDQRVPIALAALSPSSIRLAGELADEWTPFLWARSRLDEGRALLGESRTRVSVGVPVALAPGRAGASELAAWWLSTYVTKMGPLYPRMLGERFGMRAAVHALGELGDAKPSLPAVAEELAEDVTLMATFDRADDAIGAWFAAGADNVSLVLPPGRLEAELTEILEVAADAMSSARAA
jgi:alkanesulfonate monooxygenase SsuD/methylene tetrahydromethanopterin reductase-like flavin-dependent oxidoreductase (luciferase family)